MTAILKRNRPPRESGSVYLTVLVGLTALLGLTSLAIDVGVAYNSRTQAQAAVDATALAAAQTMIDSTSGDVTLASSQTAAVGIAAQNAAYPNPSLVLDLSDLVFGDWDLDSRTLDTAIDPTDPDQLTAVEATLRLDGTTNPEVPALMSRVLGRDSFQVETTATAYLGWAGSVLPGAVDLPIAIPCCVLNGSACEDTYCGSGAPVPNPCPLVVPQARGEAAVSCIQFHNTAEQTGCWTQFDGVSASVNTADLVDIADDGLDEGVTADEDIFLDNGDKVPVLKVIHDRFYGVPPYDTPELKMGSDTDLDGREDSWVIGLPVVECQSTDHCAKGLPVKVKGFVCVEIREVSLDPPKMIRVNFLCAELHPEKYAECKAGLGPTGTGGEDFDIRADIPVLVR